MYDRTPNDPPTHDALAAALHARGITTPDAFRAAFGVAPGTLTAAAALTLVTAPAWVRLWLTVNDPTPCVWVPQAVRAYAAVFGFVQGYGETDDSFVRRVRASLPYQQMER